MGEPGGKAGRTETWVVARRQRPVVHGHAVIERLGIGDDFLLFVGTIEPRKGLETLLRAFEQIAENNKTLQLVMAGQRGWLAQELLKEIRESSLADRIKLTGYLNDEDLRALYSSCRVFVYPSIYEGFGLPPLEAMACGAPVIASRIKAIEEVCGESAMLLEPRSVNSLATSLNKILNDKNFRAELVSAGRKRAARFSWKRTAELTRAVYAEAAERFSSRQFRNR